MENTQNKGTNVQGRAVMNLGKVDPAQLMTAVVDFHISSKPQIPGIFCSTQVCCDREPVKNHWHCAKNLAKSTSNVQIFPTHLEE